MNLLLVATNREKSPFPVAPLGALCVAAAARAAGHEVRLLDLGSVRFPQRALQQALASAKPQVVGFSIRNLDNCFVLAPRLYFDEVLELVKSVRRSFRGPILLGGSGFSVAPRGWLQRVPADCGVVGEGEEAIVEVLARLESGRSLEGLEGVLTQATREGPNGAAHGRALEDLSTLTLPAHELCRYPKYLSRGGFASVQTKRGCPFGCIYCIYPQLEGRRYRLRPPKMVVDEVEGVYQSSGASHVFFADSVFNDPRDHALAVCEELSRRALPVRWMTCCNPVGFDHELACAMARAGCEGLDFGMDAATPKMLKVFRKPFDQAAIQVAMQAAHDAGLPFAVHLLVGAPGETWPDVEEAQAFLNSCAPANAVFASFGIRVYEGTAMQKLAVQEGVLPKECDLFEPFYYTSPALAGNTEETLDRITRRREEWTSPIDWRRPLMRWTQGILNWLDVRPQWKDIRGYGQHLRK